VSAGECRCAHVRYDLQRNAARVAAVDESISRCQEMREDFFSIGLTQSHAAAPALRFMSACRCVCRRCAQ
jgi:hypothetical protein